MNPRRPALAGIFALVLLGGCATSPTGEPTSAEADDKSQAPLTEAERWALHRDAVTALGSWQLRGKVAYRLPDDAGSASLLWEQTGEQSELRLSGPLGVGSTLIRNDGPLIRVRRDGIDRLYAADAAPWLPDGELLPIPISSLPYWLRGVPDPELRLERLDLAKARATVIRQAGWVVTIEAYQAVGALALPERIKIRNEAGELSLTVLLRDWDIRQTRDALQSM